ncbi:MAG: IS6 family transposase [SAR202 cluster bacterium]|nr:IS6 family transposase [SAR202 cluster bacterium]
MQQNALSDTLTAICPTCSESDVIKYGHRDGKQLYWCKPCRKKFAAGQLVPHRKIGSNIVGDAIANYYAGMSYRDIIDEIQREQGFSPSPATVYEWVRDYVNRAERLTDGLRFRTGDTWVVDEMVVKIDGRNVWLWNVMDAKSRFLLSTHLSFQRNVAEAERAIRMAAKRSALAPKVIKTDGLLSYQEGIDRVLGGNTKHVVSLGMRHTINNNLIERLNGTVRERTKVMRGMETKPTAQTVIDGFRIYYNFMRPHQSLRGKTPAEAVGVGNVFRSWRDVARLHDRSVEQKRAQLLNEHRFTPPIEHPRMFKKHGQGVSLRDSRMANVGRRFRPRV